MTDKPMTDKPMTDKPRRFRCEKCRAARETKVTYRLHMIPALRVDERLPPSWRSAEADAQWRQVRARVQDVALEELKKAGIPAPIDLDRETGGSVEWFECQCGRCGYQWGELL